MRPVNARRPLLALSAAALALSVSACADVSGSSTTKADTKDAPAPAAALPSPLAAMVRTDLGEYLVKPKAGTSDKVIKATLARLRAMPGVQSAELNAEGKLDVQFLGQSTPAQRQAAVKQLAALGPVELGV